jgi:hypothetical protein
MSGSSKISIGGLVEQFGPLAGAVVTFATVFYFKDHILDLSKREFISITELYTAVFDWASIQSGFLFGIYGFIAGKNDGFIGEIRHTRSMQIYNKYLWRAIVVGFSLTASTIPLLVTQYEPKADSQVLFYIVVLWVSLFVWAFLAFARVAYIFGILVKTRGGTGIPAG